MAVQQMMPNVADENSIRIAAYASIALMPLIEAYILKVSSTLVLKGLTQSNKYKSNGKTL
jgi:Na+-transporting methylmalonyl-CoA/oxaloacetate decarboxylase beta subunit